MTMTMTTTRSVTPRPAFAPGRPHRGPWRGPWLALALVLCSSTALAQADALRQCRGLVDAGARLACYDALPLAAPAPSAAEPAASTPVAATFGLARPDDKVQEIVSHIPGLLDGWRRGTLIRLANGQVWQVTDDDTAVYNLRDAKVTVRRAVMGTFVLDIEGANRVPRVRRVE